MTTKLLLAHQRPRPAAEQAPQEAAEGSDDDDSLNTTLRTYTGLKRDQLVKRLDKESEDD